MARPTKYTDQEIINALLKGAAEGQTDRAIAAHDLDVAHDYISERAKKSERLSEAIKKAKGLREHFYLDLGLKIARGKRLKDQDGPPNPTMFIWITRNVLGWRDEPKEESETKDASQSVNKVYVTQWGGTREPGSEGDS